MPLQSCLSQCEYIACESFLICSSRFACCYRIAIIYIIMLSHCLLLKFVSFCLSILSLGTWDGFASTLVPCPWQSGLSFTPSSCDVLPLCLPQEWAAIFELRGVRQDLCWDPFSSPGTICTSQRRGNVLAGINYWNLILCNLMLSHLSEFAFVMHSLWICSLLIIFCERSLLLQLPTKNSGKYNTWEMSMWRIFGSVKAFWKEFSEAQDPAPCKWKLGNM